MRRSFSIQARGEIFYVQFWNPETKKYSSAISTGAKDRDSAIAIVADWMRNGIPSKAEGQESARSVAEALTIDAILYGIKTAPLSSAHVTQIVKALKERGLILSAALPGTSAAELLSAFLKRFWDYEKSEYVKEKKLHGQTVGLRRCLDQSKMIPEWEAWFGPGKRIGEVSTADLRAFSMHLAEKGNAPATINHKMETGVVSLRWAFSHGLIEADPTRGLRRFSGRVKTRGILTEAETKKLFGAEWKDKRALVGNILAATTGMRAGEVLGLRVEDIGEERLQVRHSWNHVTSSLKGTKTEKPRVVPLLPEVRMLLLELVQENPHGSGPDKFVFYGERSDRPMVHNVLRDHLDHALTKIDINREEKLARGICFHSWRHYFAARMSDQLETRKVQRATGHMTTAMAEHYAAHELESDLKDLNAASQKAFGTIVPCKRSA